MNILIAMDSFKGSLSAQKACRTAAEGLRDGFPDVSVSLFPMADGGEGTVECMIAQGRGEMEYRTVEGPFGAPIRAGFGRMRDGKTGVVETAAASGIAGLRPEELDPLRATTYGTGQLILAALEAGCRRIIVGLGGSAANDGGMGALQALGFRFYATDGSLLAQGGSEMERVARIDPSEKSPLPDDTEIILACDVKNPFFGPDGAAYVFAPQKGASPEDVRRLDRGLQILAARYEETFGVDMSTPGAGAAGGLCGGLFAALGGQIHSGFDAVAKQTGLAEAIAQCDLVLTGEGKTDAQTVFGKLPFCVGRLAKAASVPCICVSGGLAPGCETLWEHGISCLFDTTLRPMTNADAMACAEDSLRFVCQNIGRLLATARL